jgi:hypothetical protein
MAPRSAGRSWATEQLFTKTKTSIYAVQWYELAARDITEVEVGARGRIFSRAIANGDLEDEHRRSALEQIMEGLAREIDTTQTPPACC